MKKKTRIIAVVGPSGSGKTTAVEFASRALNIPVVVSYTTRPMREGGVNGKDHFFVSEAEMPKRCDMLAYTKFGGYDYWTEKQQIEGLESVFYVIDEKGLDKLLEKYNYIYDIAAVRVKCPSTPWLDDENRINRDNERMTMPDTEFDEVISNTGTLEFFLAEFTMTIRDMLWELKINRN